MKYILFYIFENVFANFPINYYNSDNTLYYMYNFQLTKFLQYYFYYSFPFEKMLE